MKARRSHIKIIYEGKDITGELTPYLKSTSYTDNLDKGDSASFSLIGDMWIDQWPILKGDKFQMEIVVIDWLHEGDNRSLNCGTFTVDDISLSGAPDLITVSGTSIDISKGIKDVKRDATWENVSLKEIAQDIASKNSLQLFYDCEEAIYDKVDQVKESDSHLLHRIAKEQGLKMKIMDSNIIIFDEEKYEKIESIISFQKSSLTSYNLQCNDLDVYDACEITYYDLILGEYLKGRFEAPTSKLYKSKTGKILYKNIDTGVIGNTKEEKEKFLDERAKKLLRGSNKNETKISMSQMGDPNYAAGLTMALSEFGIYSGTYLIDSVTHNIDDGYKCSISGKRRLDF